MIGQSLHNPPVQRENTTQWLLGIRRILVIDTVYRIISVPLALFGIVLNHTFIHCRQITQNIICCNRAETIRRWQNWSAAICNTLITHLFNIGITGIKTQIKVLGNLLVHFQRNIGTSIIRSEFHTILIHVVNAKQHFGLFSTTRNWKVMIMRERISINLLLDIIRLHIAITFYAARVGSRITSYSIQFLQWFHIAVTTNRSCTCPAICQVVIRIERIHILSRCIELRITIVADNNTSFFSPLCGNKNYTISTTGTINSRWWGIFQNVNRLNLIARNITQRATDSINQYQRIIALWDRTATTYTNRNSGIGTSILRCYIDTGQLTLQSLSCIGNRHSCNLLTRNRGYRSGKVLTFHRLITDYYNFIQNLSIFSQCHMNRLPCYNGYSLRLHSDKTYFQLFGCTRHGKGEFTIQVCNCTDRSVTYYSDISTNNRITSAIEHNTWNSTTLCKRDKADHTHQESSSCPLNKSF